MPQILLLEGRLEFLFPLPVSKKKPVKPYSLISNSLTSHKRLWATSLPTDYDRLKININDNIVFILEKASSGLSGIVWVADIKLVL